jgi:hypothetical protein
MSLIAAEREVKSTLSSRSVFEAMDLTLALSQNPIIVSCGCTGWRNVC